jgi:hypothetical protein
MFIAVISAQAAFAQDLTPRAYIITPVHSNAIILSYSFYSGGILLNGALPITDSSLPYGVGHFQGKLNTAETTVYRSGLLDSYYRFSVNIKGGPALSPQEFRNWRQKTIVGVSLKVVAPTGQYDPAKLINFGANRWAFKPELGLSHRKGHWVLDAYGAVWFFTTNNNYLSHSLISSGTNKLTEKPVGAFEGHLSYSVKPRLWFSLDGNFWFGGRTSINGKEDLATLQKNSRIGGTASIPLTRHQSVKFSYNNGAYIRYGGNYQSVSVAWQYSWLGRPK